MGERSKKGFWGIEGILGNLVAGDKGFFRNSAVCSTACGQPGVGRGDDKSDAEHHEPPLPLFGNEGGYEVTYGQESENQGERANRSHRSVRCTCSHTTALRILRL